MCQIEDDDIGRLWTQHYPKLMDDIKSKAVCLTLFYVIADRAHLIYPCGDWSDKIQQALRFYGVSKEQYYKVGKDAVETWASVGKEEQLCYKIFMCNLEYGHPSSSEKPRFDGISLTTCQNSSRATTSRLIVAVFSPSLTAKPVMKGGWCIGH